MPDLSRVFPRVAVAVATLSLLAAADTAAARPRRTTITVQVRLDSGAAVRGAGQVVVARARPVVCRSRCRVPARVGARVTLRAADRAGYAFDHWADASRCVQRRPRGRRCTLVPRGPVTVTALFRPQTHRLSVVASGGGDVTSGGNGIDCGDGATACSADFAAATVVTLHATPPAGSRLVGWSVWECPSPTPDCRIAMDGDRTVAALMDPVHLTVSREGTGGAIVSDPPGISCGAGCDTQTAAFRRHTRVTLTATAPPGGPDFRRWSDPCGGGLPVCAFTLVDDDAVVGTFGDIAPPFPGVGPIPGSQELRASTTYRVTLTVKGPGSVTAPGPGGHPNVIHCQASCSSASWPLHGAIPITAHPRSRARLASWRNGCPGRRLSCSLPVLTHSSIYVRFAGR